jgi:hypothetical protein
VKVTRGYPLDSAIIEGELKRAENMGIDLTRDSDRNLVRCFIDELRAIRDGERIKIGDHASQRLNRLGLVKLGRNPTGRGNRRYLTARGGELLSELEAEEEIECGS